MEKQILLWERKITLEKEMQAALDATDGEVIGAMKKEIQRMEQRHAELRRLQEKLMVVSAGRMRIHAMNLLLPLPLCLFSLCILALLQPLFGQCPFCNVMAST